MFGEVIYTKQHLSLSQAVAYLPKGNWHTSAIQFCNCVKFFTWIAAVLAVVCWPI